MDDNNTLERAEMLSAAVDNTIMTLSIMHTDSPDYIDDYITELQTIAKAAKTLDYSEVVKVSQWCQQNLAFFKENAPKQMEALIESGESWRWLELISAYLVNPDETSYASALSVELLRADWSDAYQEEDLLALLLQLKTLPLAIDQVSNTDTQTTTASTSACDGEQAETTSLAFTWDDDTHPEFLEAFFEETAELVSELAPLLENVTCTKEDSENRHHASRLAHTIKGGSAVAGITALSTFSYRLEKILEYSVKHTLADDIYPLLAESGRCLDVLFQAVKEKTGEPQNFASVFNKLSRYAETLEEDSAPLTLGKPKLPDFITQQGSQETIESTVDNIPNKNTEDVECIENIEENTSCVEIDEIIMMLSMLSADNESGYTRYIDELRCLDAWAEFSGYSTIAKTSQWVQQNLAYFDENKCDKTDFITSGECWMWLDRIRAILAEPEESSYLAELTTELMRDEWAIPFEMEALQNLLMQLRDPKFNSSNRATDEENEEENKEEDTYEVTPYQFSWDDDVHPELLASYLGETPDQIEQVAQLLIKISKGKANKEDHQQASRIAHTIKGASAVVGLTALVEFTHKLEDILDYSINHSLPKEVSSLLADASDCLEDMFDAILSKESAPEEFYPLLKRLTEYSETLEQEDMIDLSLFELSTLELSDFIANDPFIKESTTSEKDLSSQTDATIVEETVLPTEKTDSIDKINKEKQLDVALENPNTSQETDFSALISVAEQATTSFPNHNLSSKAVLSADSTIRVPVAIMDKLFNLVGELVTTSIQITDKLDKAIATSKQVKSQDVRVHKMLEELDTTLLKQEKEQFKIIASLQQENGFDHLEMDTYNELHSINGLLTESILDAEAIEDKLEKQLYALKDEFHALDTLNSDLSDVILKSRMVSINSLVPRLERIVRQTSRKTKKQAELIVTGNEIDVDTDILNGLTDPLLHLLRNAIDHGIEYPTDREAKQKDKTGKITLDFSRRGNHIQMQIKDDGAGIDAEKVYQKAIEQGLIAADKKLSKEEKLQLILYAGFSTQRNVTDISGRGVGMDVVNSAVRKLNGILSIESDPDRGTTFTITIPLTLVTSATLLVNVSGYQVAIPTESIEQLYYLEPENVIEREQGYFVLYQEREIPIQSLATLIGFPANTPDFSQGHTLLFVKSLSETHAIYIDEVISSRQTVIKSLSDWLDTSKGLMGACHLPEGEVAPVINLPKILNINEKTNQIIKQIQHDSAQQAVKEHVAKILVVDDSLSNRKALSLVIEQTEFEVMTAVDGLDALQIMNENQIDMVFTDLEMPRMNGIELTQAIRVWESKKETPVVMITSRTTSKHRKLAKKAGVDDYLTKPVVTETLLNSIHQWLEKAVA